MVMVCNKNILKKMLRLFIIHILMHLVQCTMEYSYDKDLYDAPEYSNFERPSKQQKYDQLLSNLHDLFKEKNDSNQPSRRGEDENDFNLIKEDKKEFDEVLGEVTIALDKIEADLIKFNNDTVVTVEVPVQTKENRYKRDISNETFANVTVIDDIGIEHNETTTEKAETVTETVENVTENNTIARTELLRENNDTDSAVSGRRMMPNIITTSRVKDKLLSYLDDTFNEVERKIKPLTNIKIALSNDDHYRIGYIIATIDTLEVNLKKLKNDMNLHQHVWNDEKILDLFDRIKATNTVATSLIESLKNYLPRN